MSANAFPISFEFFPTKTPEGAAKHVQVRQALYARAPQFCSVTYGAGGSTQEGTFAMVQAIQQEGVAAAAHFSCIGATRDKVRAELQQLQSMGVRRLVALRGDLPSGYGMGGQFHYASDLVAFIRQEFGDYFHIEVAAYPEMHPQARSPEADLQAFATKVRAGANAAITQYFYNADAYARFVDDVQRLGVSIPVVPGIMPITNSSQLMRFSDGLPQLSAVSPLISGPAFARRGQASMSVALLGVDPVRYRRIVNLDDAMVAGSFRLDAQDAVIGSQLAADLGLRMGDKLRLDAGQGRESVVNVAGIFPRGVRELDARYVYLGMQPTQALLNLPGAAPVLEVTLHQIFDAQRVAEQIARLTGLKAQSWIATNTQLMNALQSQRLSTQMISLFVALSVALGIASVLAVSVVQRTREIGILRAMGATRRQMLRIFLLQGAVLGLLGSLLGSAASYGLAGVFNTFAENLFYVPIDPWLPVLAAALATLTGVVAAAIPARRAAQLDPVEAIRHA